MSAPEHLSTSLATLTDRELEILRLLTAGHTVKSIAASLGRSEASINERLRDARRKTGIGSSRELARLLDAQKIWDRKIDLSTQPASDDEGRRRPDRWRPRSKGAFLMLIAMPVVAAAASLMAMASGSLHHAAPPRAMHAASAGQAPLAGRWSLDVARIPAEERPRAVTMAFTVSPERRWTTRIEIIAPDGSAQHAESTAAPDGVPVPVTGNMTGIDTVALRQPAPNTLVMTLGKGGVPVSTRVYAVAKDRRSMTETIVWAGQDLPKLETTRFHRID